MCCFRSTRKSLRVFAVTDLAISVYFLCNMIPILIGLTILHQPPFNFSSTESIGSELLTAPGLESKMINKSQKQIKIEQNHVLQPRSLPMGDGGYDQLGYNLEILDQSSSEEITMKKVITTSDHHEVENENATVKHTIDSDHIIPFGKDNSRISKALLLFGSATIFGFMAIFFTVSAAMLLLLGCKKMSKGESSFLFGHIFLSGIVVILTLLSFSKILRSKDRNFELIFRKLFVSSVWTRKSSYHYQPHVVVNEMTIERKIHDTFTTYLSTLMIIFLLYKLVEVLMVLSYICEIKRIQRILAMRHFQMLLFEMNRRDQQARQAQQLGDIMPQHQHQSVQQYLLDRPPSYNSLPPIVFGKKRYRRVADSSNIQNHGILRSGVNSATMISVDSQNNFENQSLSKYDNDSDEKPPPTYESILFRPTAPTSIPSSVSNSNIMVYPEDQTQTIAEITTESNESRNISPVNTNNTRNDEGKKNSTNTNNRVKKM